MRINKSIFSIILLCILVVALSKPIGAFADGGDLSQEDFDPFFLKHIIGIDWYEIACEWEENGIEIFELSSNEYNTFYGSTPSYHGYLGLDFEYTIVSIGVDNITGKIEYASYYSFYEDENKQITADDANLIINRLYPYLDEPDSFDTNNDDDLSKWAWLDKIDKQEDKVYYAFYHVADWMDVIEIKTGEENSFEFVMTKPD